jgi:hypothetical protein
LDSCECSVVEEVGIGEGEDGKDGVTVVVFSPVDAVDKEGEEMGDGTCCEEEDEVSMPSSFAGVVVVALLFLLSLMSFPGYHFSLFSPLDIFAADFVRVGITHSNHSTNRRGEPTTEFWVSQLHPPQKYFARGWKGIGRISTSEREEFPCHSVTMYQEDE